MCIPIMDNMRKDCTKCIHLFDDEYCDECSNLNEYFKCSCHIKAPCNDCVDNLFEEEDSL